MTCTDRGCDREATIALRTDRPQRDNLKTTIFWDCRAEKVPKKAEPYCTEHGLAIINELAQVLA